MGERIGGALDERAQGHQTRPAVSFAPGERFPKSVAGQDAVSHWHGYWHCRLSFVVVLRSSVLSQSHVYVSLV